MECSKLEFLQTDTSTLNLHVLFQISLVVDMVGDMNLKFPLRYGRLWQHLDVHQMFVNESYSRL